MRRVKKKKKKVRRVKQILEELYRSLLCLSYLICKIRVINRPSSSVITRLNELIYIKQ